MATHTSTTPQEANSPTVIEHFRQQLSERQKRVGYLRSRSQALSKAIEQAGSASPSYPHLQQEKRDVDRRLRTAELEVQDTTSMLAKRERAAARKEFDELAATMLSLRFEIIEHLRAASDLFGKLVQAQRRAPSLANACAVEPPGLGYAITSPADIALIRQMNEPLDVYSGKWLDGRRMLPVELDARCIRLQPTEKI